MSAEVERLFSTTKLMLPLTRNKLGEDEIEAAECIRSWTLQGLILGDYFEYLRLDLRKTEENKKEENFRLQAVFGSE
jgi:hypothetical protein